MAAVAAIIDNKRSSENFQTTFFQTSGLGLYVIRSHYACAVQDMPLHGEMQVVEAEAARQV